MFNVPHSFSQRFARLEAVLVIQQTHLDDTFLPLYEHCSYIPSVPADSLYFIKVSNMSSEVC